jgi:hypothetical protein
MKIEIKKIAFNGSESDDFDKIQQSDENLELVAYYKIRKPVRGKDNRKTIELDLEKNPVIEFEFDDGTSWITKPDDMFEIFPGMREKINRSVTDVDTVELPLELSVDSTDRSMVGNILLKAFKIFAKKKTPDTVKKLATKLENKQLEGKIGLFALDENLQFKNFTPDNSAQPYLLLIHGTASSTKGSFGKAIDTDLMNFVRDRYKDRILAFQHRTLTENPIQNVKHLVQSLPDNCVLHLITTSRGGLVGEVLSRFCNSLGTQKGFNNTEIQILKKEYPDSYFSEIEGLISEITQIVGKKNITIGKLIRIACPAGGTTLASKRLDYFFNISLNLIGLGAGMAANPAYMAFRSLTAAVIDCKNNPDVLPGLEVQKPDSPFIKVLNCNTDLENSNGNILINNSLIVISGNSKPAARLNALLVIASKLFFLRKNDLVVDTEAMSLGTKRAGRVLQFFYEDSQLNHFKYFENSVTNHAVITALKTEWGKAIPGFKDLELSVLPASERNIKARPAGGSVKPGEISGKRPIVVLLPGIMGSNLKLEDNLIWIKYFRLISGGLGLLDAGNKRVKPDSLVQTAYGDLVEALKSEYDVVPFPFDWRLSLQESAEKLNRALIGMMKHKQPIKLIGHSMGGVLIRDFIVSFKETWEKLNHSKDFKLIFLGTPLNGSYRIPAVLMGMDTLINKLSLIDLVHSKKELLEIFTRYKGLLSLLPLDGKQDFSKPETWKEMTTGLDEDKWPVPSAKDLSWFGEYKTQMKDALKNEDLKNAVYIAGRDKATTCDYQLVNKKSGKELVFYSTAEGDFSVTWESGIPNYLKENNLVYYVNVSHGELACNREMFKGIREILQEGKTSLFSTTQPVVRGNEKLFVSPEFRDFDLSEAGIDLSVLGVGGNPELNVGMPPLKVSISHGNLYYAMYPLLAGHFEDDGILSAEKQINDYLEDTLVHRYSLGIYPGKIGTNDLFLTEMSGFRGAVIIGLGKPENLTAFELTKSVEQGICNYLLSLKPEKKPEWNENHIEYVGISSLIIGSGYGNLPVEDSIKGIIQGIHNANVKVKNIDLEIMRQIGSIEFVELFEDAAVSALYSLSRIENQETRSFNIQLEEKKLQTLLGGRKRIQNQFTSGWWNRITVKHEEADKNTPFSHLTFSASTSRAHEKEIPLLTTPALIEGTIQEISTKNRWSPDSAKAIFELFIPNDFKEQLKRHGNINWIVDHYTAEFPWELLQDEIDGAKPLCVASGMIRQLSTQNYRQIIKSSPKNNVLVIADPDLDGFASQLPGALKEGQMVSKKLSSHDMSPTTSFRGNSDEIINKMFSKEYRIIHLSGHGIFNEDPTKGSGMVIGDNLFLSTREIRQMSNTPELVFVNCCHIGKISGVAEELYQKRYKLAANIGTQLIENGVRCVIAAGWAVDDSAALEFAEVFYERLLEGYTFGESVHAARKSVFEKYGSTNTWGAYQCYGDPFYRFKKREGKDKDKKSGYLIPQEAEIDLLNLLSELEIGNKSTAEYTKMLENISALVDNAQIRTPQITEKEAQIYLELKDYNKACEKYSALLNVADASFSFSVAEKYFMAMAKKIVADFTVQLKNIDEKEETKRKVQEDKLRKESVAAIEKVAGNLVNLVELMPSFERINILASTFKRKAFITSKDNNKGLPYEKAAYYYQKAYHFSNNWYSLTNWLALESTLVLSEIHQWDSDIKIKGIENGYRLVSYTEALQLLEAAQATINEKDSRMSYWHQLAKINIGLCKYVIQFSNPKKVEGEHELKQIDIFNDIGELWKKAGTKGKRFAEIEHIEFIIDGLDNKKKNADDLAKRLIHLKQELLKLIQE